MAVTCSYFILVSRDVYPLLLCMTLLATFGFVLDALFLPESPIWLLNQGRTKDAIKALNYIGRFNGVKTQLTTPTLFMETQQQSQADDEAAGEKD